VTRSTEVVYRGSVGAQDGVHHPSLGPDCDGHHYSSPARRLSFTGTPGRVYPSTNIDAADVHGALWRNATLSGRGGTVAQMSPPRSLARCLSSRALCALGEGAESVLQPGSVARTLVRMSLV
jgi:hypothetical protein